MSDCTCGKDDVHDFACASNPANSGPHDGGFAFEEHVRIAPVPIPNMAWLTPALNAFYGGGTQAAIEAALAAERERVIAAAQLAYGECAQRGRLPHEFVTTLRKRLDA